jgi:hypothetical protein
MVSVSLVGSHILSHRTSVPNFAPLGLWAGFFRCDGAPPLRRLGAFCTPLRAAEALILAAAKKVEDVLGLKGSTPIELRLMY